MSRVGFADMRRGRAAVPAGWWVIAGRTCVGAYRAKGAGSLAASYANLSVPASPLTLGVAPAFADGTGWGFTGSQYLKTGIVVDTLLYTVAIRYSSAGFGNIGPIGTFDGSNDASLYMYPANGGVLEVHYASNAAYSAAFTDGVVIVAGPQVYKDGIAAQLCTRIGTSGGAQQLFIGAINVTGSPALYFTGNVQAVAIYSDTLTGGEAGTLSTAMAAL